MEWKKVLEHNLKFNIQANNVFKPFNDDFDYNLIKKYVSESKPLTPEESILFELLPKFHNVYVNYYSYLKALHEEYHLSPINLYKYLIAIANRDYITFLNILEDHLLDSDIEHAENLNGTRVKSIFGPGLIGIEAAETTIDVIDLIMSYYRYFADEKTPTLKFDSNVLKILYAKTSYFVVLKSIFEQVIWEGAYFIKDENNNNHYLIAFSQDNYLENKQIGINRMRRITEEEALHPAVIKAAKLVYQQRCRQKEKTKNQFFIADIKDGRITLKKEKIKGMYKRYITQADIDRYGANFYSCHANLFFDGYDKSFPKLFGLSVYDMIILFVRIQALAAVVVDQEKLTGEIRDDDPNKLLPYCFCIRKENLIEYLHCTTVFQERQVIKFLELIVANQDTKNKYPRFNSWEKMLIESDGYYYFPLLPLIGCNILQLIEGWLEKCGESPANRGHSFENYCKARLGKKEEKSNCVDRKILEEIKFKLETEVNEREEIDLVLLLGDYIVVGELKTLSYPMTPLQWHTANSQIANGVTQVIRKSEFFKKYRTKLIGKYPDIMNKQVVPVVITNYPLYAGRSLQGVPVIDINLLCNILNNVPLTQRLLVGERSVKVKEEYYFEDMDDFNLRFKDILNNPLPIAELRNDIEYNDVQISLFGDGITFLTRHYFVNRKFDNVFL